MNRSFTLLAVVCILVAGVAGNLWLRSQRMRMEKLEASLRESSIRALGTESVGSGRQPGTKASEREIPVTRDAVDSVNAIKDLEQRRRGSEIDGMAFSKSLSLVDYAGASVEELRALATELEQSGLYPGMIRQMRQKIASHLANIDPKAATLLALEEGDGRTFGGCLSQWIKTDAKGALAWMESVDPPLSPSRFEEIGQLNLDDLRLVTRLAVDPAGAALPPLPTEGRFSSAYSKMSNTLSPAGMADVIKRLESAGSMNPELPRLIANLVAGYPDPRTSLQILVDAELPAPQLKKLVGMLIVNQDPPGARRGIEWYCEAVSGEARSQGLREIISGWARSDRASAIEWIEALKDPVEKVGLLELAKTAPDH